MFALHNLLGGHDRFYQILLESANVHADPGPWQQECTGDKLGCLHSGDVACQTRGRPVRRILVQVQCLAPKESMRGPDYNTCCHARCSLLGPCTIPALQAGLPVDSHSLCAGL